MIERFEYISPTGAAMPLLNNDYFNLIEISGFTLAQSDIASVTVPFVDGDTVTNMQTTARTVTLYLKLKQAAGIEAAKRYIFQFVKLKKEGTIQLEQDGHKIELVGIVESIDLPRFQAGCTMAVTLHCSQPYWRDIDYVVKQLSIYINLHHFEIAFPSAGVPFGAYDIDQTQNFNNSGDVDTGVVITIIALNTVVNPKIRSTLTGEFIGVNDTLTTNQSVTISTIKGRKAITKDGTNIIDKIMSGSTFLQLVTGQNEFSIEADSGVESVYFTIQYKRLYV